MLPDNAISQTDFDQIAGDRDEAAAALKVAKAARELVATEPEFHPRHGAHQRPDQQANVDPGNMVQADQTALTTIVSQDPIYADFAVDERTTLRVRRLIRAGIVKSSSEDAMPVFLGLCRTKRDIPTRAHSISSTTGWTP